MSEPVQSSCSAGSLSLGSAPCAASLSEGAGSVVFAVGLFWGGEDAAAIEVRPYGDMVSPQGDRMPRSRARKSRICEASFAGTGHAVVPDMRRPEGTKGLP